MTAAVLSPPPAPTIGAMMANSKRWLVYKLIQRPNKPKPDKVPFYVNGTLRQGVLDSAGDVANLGSYQEAVAAQKRGGFDGLGFALGPDGTGNYWQGIDFDKVSLNQHLVPLMDKMQGYSETSPSGDGKHWIGYGPDNFHALSNEAGIEAYSSGRFFTFTSKDAVDSPVVDLGPIVQRHLVPLRAPRPAPPPRTQELILEVREKVTIEQLQGYLDRIPVSSLGYGDWINVVMGVHHQFNDTPDAIGAMAALDTWSSTDTRTGQYVPSGAGSVADKWASCGRNPNLRKPGAPITIRTVQSMALKHSTTGMDLAALMLAATEDSADPGAVAAEAGTVASAVAAVTGGTKVPAHPFGAVTLQQFLEDGGEEQGWLIKGVLPRGALAQVYGDPGTGKTFIVINLMVHIARGEDWNGHRVSQGNVVYFAAEGASGARKRFRAWCQHHGLDSRDLSNNMVVVPRAPNVLEDKDFVAMGNLLKSMGKVDLVVIDTLAQVMGGGNENSSDGMGLAISRFTQLAQLVNTTVLLVHHSSKDKTQGARGWSGQVGALDTQFYVTANNGTHALTVTKQKDGVMGTVYPFRLHVVPLGVDADGDEVTSCVASPLGLVAGSEGGVLLSQTNPLSLGVGSPLNGRVSALGVPITGEWQIRVWTHIKAEVMAGIPLVHNDVVEAVTQATPPDPKKPGQPDRRRDNITRALRKMVDKNILSMDGNTIVKYNPESRKAAIPDTESHADNPGTLNVWRG